MSLIDDTKASADATTEAVTGLTTQVDLLVTGFKSVSDQLAQVLAGGTLTPADTATLQAAKDELDATAATAGAEMQKIADALQAAPPAPSPSPAPSPTQFPGSTSTGLPTL